MPSNNWSEYVRAITDGLSGRQISQASGIGESTISRWGTGATRPSPSQAVTFARAFGKSPLEALVAAEYLTPEELGNTTERPRHLQLRDFTDLELAREAVRRVEQGGHTLLEEPLDADHPAMHGSNVTPLRVGVGGSPETLTDKEVRERWGDKIPADRSEDTSDPDLRTP